MSTLKVSEIRNASSATGGLSIAADGVVSGALPYPNRNLLYNGAMQVAQRGTSATGITTSGYYTADRWRVVNQTAGTWTQTIESDAPSGSGLAKSLKMEVTTADASLGATDQFAIEQRVEGQELQRIKKGTSSAESLTLSFWVKSDTTGTYIFRVYDNDNGRHISKAYTISTADTWERKTILLAGDTSGVLDNDNLNSLNFYFHLAAGSNFTSGTLETSWASYTAANTAVGQTNLAAATNNYWQVTGVQLEVGDTATEFEFKSFGQELRECQRYYQVEQSSQTNYTTVSNGSGGFSWFFIYGTLPVTMRSTASVAINPNAYGRFHIVGGTATNTATLDRGAPPTSGSLGNVWTGATADGYTLYLGSIPSGIGRGEIVTLIGSMLMFSAEL